MRRYPTKRLLLFLAVLILPTLAILLQGRMIATRDQQLEQSYARERAETRRKLGAAEVGQRMLALLERIKGQEVANAAGVIPQPGSYSDPAVVLVGRISGREVVWPWNRANSARAHRARMQDQPFATLVKAAGQAEASKDHGRAVIAYLALIDAAGTDGQLAYARLGHARALRLSGATAEAIAAYRKILQTKPDVVNELNISFASLAAEELVGMQVAGMGMEILAPAQRDIESREAMYSLQFGQWRNVLSILRASPDAGVGRRATELDSELSRRVSDTNYVGTFPEVQLLQKRFASLPLTPTSWLPQPGHEGELWLVGRAAARSIQELPALQSGRVRDGARFSEQLMDSILPLVVVVRAESLLASLNASRPAGSLQLLRIGVDIDGEPLDEEHLPGLKIAFAPPDAAADSTPGLQRSFYQWSLLFIVPLTLLGGYLFWRDTRREMRMATLRSQFVSNVSHELKTPLTAIRMFAEALQMKYSSDTRLQQEYLDTIVKESERLTRLLDNVLDFSRIDHDQKRYHMRPTQLAEVVRSAIRSMQYPLEQQGFALDLAIDDGIPAIAADHDALQQTLLNLLTNAVKYSGDSRRIGVQLACSDGSAVIRVIDRGIGIPAQEQQRIFEAFYRVPVAENQAIAGTGLGLALVAHVTAAHGGTVRVQSTPGEGSTFCIHLPLPARENP